MDWRRLKSCKEMAALPSCRAAAARKLDSVKQGDWQCSTHHSRAAAAENIWIVSSKGQMDQAAAPIKPEGRKCPKYSQKLKCWRQLSVQNHPAVNKTHALALASALVSASASALALASALAMALAMALATASAMGMDSLRQIVQGLTVDRPSPASPGADAAAGMKPPLPPLALNCAAKLWSGGTWFSNAAGVGCCSLSM